MNVGFTGTRVGMNAKQKMTVKFLLDILLRTVNNVFHYGACVGADDEAAKIANELGYHIVAHPATGLTPLARSMLAEPMGTVWKPKPALERNKDIVDVSEVLIAVPRTSEERLRSGTWATVRYARGLNKKIWFVNPDGGRVIELGGYK